MPLEQGKRTFHNSRHLDNKNHSLSDVDALLEVIYRAPLVLVLPMKSWVNSALEPQPIRWRAMERKLIEFGLQQQGLTD
jgi:hypothetical protein